MSATVDAVDGQNRKLLSAMDAAYSTLTAPAADLRAAGFGGDAAKASGIYTDMSRSGMQLDSAMTALVEDVGPGPDAGAGCARLHAAAYSGAPAASEPDRAGRYTGFAMSL